MNIVGFSGVLNNLFSFDSVYNKLSSKGICLMCIAGVGCYFVNQYIDSLNRSNPLKDRKIERQFPPVSGTDTIRVMNGKMVSVHGTANIFDDSEIIEIHAEVPLDAIYIYSKSKKAVIRQQATRGCTAAAAFMLLADQRIKIDKSILSGCNLGDTNDMVSLIQKNHRQHTIKELESSRQNMSSLRNLLLEKGSAIVSLELPKAGGHVVVVDEISKDGAKVKLRDPYHGWEITVTGAAFLKYWKVSYPTKCLFVV